ncbi:hypothetical protein COB57_02755 [Candidatus Peregrinibacteria bacterium]|nr:MAG: hypothetical protein COB57_02755 [Candidatus Peregrinibacteria bacterium]
MLKEKTCYSCGEKATTKEHVPGKNLFPRPRPSNPALITVPSCTLHNNSFSKDEEYFLAVFMFSNAGVSDAGSKLWEEKIHRMYKRREAQGLKKNIAGSFKNIRLQNPSGSFSERIAIEIDESRIKNVIGKIVKGLYFFEYEKKMASSAKLNIHFLKTSNDFQFVEKQIQYLKPGKRSWAGVFRYMHYKTEENTDSIWLLDFYGVLHFCIAA